MKKKKVGIITFHNEQNYGAILQAYALQKTIQNLGCDSYVINYIEPVEKYWKDIITEKNKLLYIKIFLKVFITNILFFMENRKRKKNFLNFIDKNINLYGKYKDEKQLKEKAPELNVYITGSDQVWNAKITKGLKDAYTLNFGAENIIRASYAASLGSNKIDKNDEKEYQEKLKVLDEISVREQSGKELLEKILDRDIEVVLDPTLLLDKETWNEVEKSNVNKGQKYILVYDLEKNDLIYEVAKELSRKLEIPIINFRRKKQEGVISKYECGPDEFLKLFDNAELIITNSFHGAVFSIIFHKKFYVLPHTKTFARTENLLKLLELETQIINNENQIKNISIEENIDYNKVDEKLKIEKEKSITYLKKVLNY